MMIRILASVLAGVCAAGSLAHGQDLVSAGALNELGYYKYWQNQIPLEDGDTIKILNRVDGTLYAVSDRGAVYAVQADTGLPLWSYRAAQPGDWVFLPSHTRSFYGRDLTLITTSRVLEWRDRFTGELVARIEPGFVPSERAVSDGVRVFAPGLDARMHCLEFTLVNDEVRAYGKWQTITGEVSLTSPVLWSGGLFFASKDGKVRACVADNKQRLWVFRTLAPVVGDMHVDSTGVYFGSIDRMVYKLDVESGRGIARFRTPGYITSAPSVVGETVFQIVDNHGLYALDSASLEQRWHIQEASGLIAVSDTQTLLMGDGEILAVESAGGTTRQRIPALDVEIIVPNIVSSAMFLASRDGRILCAQEQHVPFLRFEQLTAAYSAGTTAAAAVGQGDEAPDDAASRRSRLRELLSNDSAAFIVGQDD